MEWSIVGTEQSAEEPSVPFDPSAVVLLSQLASSTPWLSGLDPYRDQVVAGEELAALHRDLQSVLDDYRAAFLSDFAKSKGHELSTLKDHLPYLFKEAVRRFEADRFAVTLTSAIVLAETAASYRSKVRIVGT